MARDLHQTILRVLLDQAQQDAYPSVTVLDMIEQRLRPEDLDEYADLLLEKIRQDTYPSLDHLRRLQQLA